MKIRQVLLGAALCTLATGASAAIYVDSRELGFTALVGTLDLSITTDDTIGVLTGANIIDYSIVVFDTFNQFTLTPANSTFLLNGTGLSASATDLTFDFGAAGFLLFQNPVPGSGGPFYCLQTDTACFDSSGPGEAGGPNPGFYLTNYYQGPQVIASVGGAVPEPATWAMMSLGFGAIGFSLRRGRHGRHNSNRRAATLRA